MSQRAQDEPTGSSPALRAAQLEGFAVLIVEDDADSSELLAMVVEEHGARVKTAFDSVTALEALGGTQFDVVISDIGLPGHDGIWLVEEARRRGLQAPFIALSAYADSMASSRALAAGFLAYLIKPIDPTLVIQAVLRHAKPNR
ncbi:response regulator [Chondromyces crocatus]|uniref:Response regulatory domain-containing protein n=1 Tax=Chondromyces crocatus TaxID=52 RepID=A0A0K1EA13_CHOCO|nr:response regulator [Chondromyces crocatus]AKT37716.1 uncharacterized protein CMC5_018580 [Chondromyces crocatus]